MSENTGEKKKAFFLLFQKRSNYSTLHEGMVVVLVPTEECLVPHRKGGRRESDLKELVSIPVCFCVNTII